MLKRAALLLLVALIGIQFYRPQKNVSTQAPGPEDFLVKHAAPDEVRRLFSVACYDCHSNNTRYPWYAEIQPLGWWLDVDGDGHGLGRQLEPVRTCEEPVIAIRAKCTAEQSVCYHEGTTYGFCTMSPDSGTGVCVIQGPVCRTNSECPTPFVCVEGPLWPASTSPGPRPRHVVPGGGEHMCVLPDTDVGFGWASDGQDCNEWSLAQSPGAAELCNRRDDDCDGLVDEDFDLTSDAHCGGCDPCSTGTHCVDGNCL